MTLYEIINPSDPYTIEADALDVALVACIFLGRGQYAFEPIGGDDTLRIPMFIFGGTDQWCQEHFHQSIQVIVDRVLKDKSAELVTCFDSCLIGKAQDRAIYRSALELIDDPSKREEWRKKWHENRRTSTNDIGGRAYVMAKNLRDGSDNPVVPAPQQVFTNR